ncbi:MAG: hypothetical protein GEU26_11975 [Nitrososphaeraceae archaeon]|nr:hypothetical protein [Nitrososphaeraceae archaeon]
MIIKLDLTFIPSNIRSLLVKSIDIESNDRVINEGKVNGRDSYDGKSNKNAGSSVLFYYDKSSLEELKNFLKNILEKNNLNQFVVVEDTENENTLAIVKQGDIEQFGMYVCIHCGLIFRDEEDRFVHERIHYFI